MIWVFIFWISLFALFCSYIGYPLFLLFISIFKKSFIYKENNNFYPKVSIIISAYNEEKVIKEKITNTLNLNYPEDRIEIIVASDGSTDRTNEICSFFARNNTIKFFSFSRRGKMAVLNSVVPQCSGDILVFTDANAILQEDTLLKIVRYFQNSRVGSVSGIKKIAKLGEEEFVEKGEGIYWKYERPLKTLESKIHSAIGADGAIYAIRRELYPFSSDEYNIADDFAISISSFLKGKRLILDNEVLALEKASENIKDEFRRKIRIADGSWRAVWQNKKIFVPFKNPVFFQFLFHKILRWLGFLFLFTLLISNFFIKGVFYNVFLSTQIVFYILSFIGIFILLKGKKINKILFFLSYFILTNIAQGIGLFSFLFKKKPAYWEKVGR